MNESEGACAAADMHLQLLTSERKNISGIVFTDENKLGPIIASAAVVRSAVTVFFPTQVHQEVTLQATQLGYFFEFSMTNLCEIDDILCI